jgi:hypothetical protein
MKVQEPLLNNDEEFQDGGSRVLNQGQDLVQLHLARTPQESILQP